MWNGLRLYLRYIGVSLRGQMQYRASFIMLSLGTFLTTSVEFMGVWVLFDRFGGLRGWTLPEVALFYGLVNVSFALAEAAGRGFDTFDSMVRSGDFDRLLLRPRSTALQVAGRDFQLMRIGRFAQGLSVLLYAAAVLEVAWTLPRILLLVGTILGGACVFGGLFVLQATMAFWTVDSLEIMNTMTYGGMQTAQYPLTIYRDWFRRFFTYIVPHNCHSPMNTLVSANVCANVPNFFIQEFDVDDAPWRDDLMTHPLQIENGYLKVPDRPGLGSDLIEEQLLKHPAGHYPWAR